jgi:subtilisin family serine protease
MVAGLAAGASAAFSGVARNAPIVSVRAANADGQLYTSAIVAAADRVYAHRADYNCRVANFSLRTGSPTTARFDPLDQAVERRALVTTATRMASAPARASSTRRRRPR